VEGAERGSTHCYMYTYICIYIQYCEMYTYMDIYNRVEEWKERRGGSRTRAAQTVRGFENFEHFAVGDEASSQTSEASLGPPVDFEATGTPGSQFTCFTGTKVHILTPEELRWRGGGESIPIPSDFDAPALTYADVC
jgi:hypothetical protein